MLEFALVVSAVLNVVSGILLFRTTREVIDARRHVEQIEEDQMRMRRIVSDNPWPLPQEILAQTQEMQAEMLQRLEQLEGRPYN